MTDNELKNRCNALAVKACAKWNGKEMPPITVSGTGAVNKRLFSPCLGFGKPRKIKAFSGRFLPG